MLKKVFFLLVLGLLFLTPKVQAESLPADSCNNFDGNVVTALTKYPGGNLDVWAKAGRAEDVGQASLYEQDMLGTYCTLIGSASINTEGWVKIGQLGTSEDAITLTLVINTQTTSFAGASAPALILADSTNPPCSLDTACQVNFRGATFSLSPKKLSSGSDTIKIGVLLPVSDNSELNHVYYSIDEKPSYVSEKLENFNLNYVSVGEHTLTRTVVLKDGQSLTDSQQIKHGDYSNVKNLLISWAYANKRLTIYISILSAVILAWLVFLIIFRAIRKQRLWKAAHVAVPIERVAAPEASPSVTGVLQPSASQVVQGVAQDSYWQEILRLKKWLLGLLGVFVIFVTVTTFIVSIFTVDGVSMYPTLQDTSKHPLLLLPKTLSRINNGIYVPTRGTIVVVQKEDVDLFTPLASQPKSYVVKRVIGLPGERVIIKDGKLYVYNKEHQEGFEPDTTYKWLKMVPSSDGYIMDVTLKDGEVFVVGDNRQESVDSRSYGPVKADRVVGKVLL